MKEIKKSYFHYLLDLGLNLSWFPEEQKAIYDQLLLLNLNDSTIQGLIREFNQRRLVIGDTCNSLNRRNHTDIRDHFVVSNIIFDREHGTFKSKYVFYLTTIDRIKNYEVEKKGLGPKIYTFNPANLVFVGINGVSNSQLMIPECVDRIVDRPVDARGYKHELRAILGEASFGMPDNLEQELDQLEQRISAGIRENHSHVRVITDHTIFHR